jgi:hypothetical protein
MKQIHCFKGTSASDIKVFSMDLTTDLKAIRKQLTAAGFMPADNEAENIGYRFAALHAKDTKSLDDCLVPKSLEHLVAVSGVLGPADQLIITNEFATTMPDLMGIGTDWWFNRYVGAKVSLNETDPTAIAQNKKIGAFPPMMLTNVVPTSKNVDGIYDNVCVCVSGTVVDFTVNSWGAAGFGTFIGADAGLPVVDGLFLPYNQGSDDTYYSTTFRRWASAPTTIEIVGTDEVNIAPGKTLSYQKVTFKTRRMTKWTQPGSAGCTSNTSPPPLKAPTEKELFEGGPTMLFADDTSTGNDGKIANAKKGAEILPGHDIKPGTPTQGGASKQNFGQPITVTVDPWTHALGEVVVFFFVFKSHADAVETINGMNAPDPSIWNK